MTEERIFEMFSNDTLRNTKSAAKTCKISTIGGKMDIIIRVKAAALKDGKNIRKFFIESMGLFGRMVFIFLPARSCLVPKIFVTIWKEP